MDALRKAHTLGEIAAIARTEARALAGSDGATFVLREGDSVYYADEDAVSPLWKGCRFPIGACISGWAMLNEQATFIADIYKDPRIPHAAYRPTFVKSLLMTPIGSVGSIGVYWASERSADPEIERRLADLAARAGAAMERVAEGALRVT